MKKNPGRKQRRETAHKNKISEGKMRMKVNNARNKILSKRKNKKEKTDDKI